MSTQHHTRLLLALAASLLGLASCQSMPYVSFLKLGKADHREAMLEEARDCRETQLSIQQDFTEIFDLFGKLIQAQAEELESLHGDLNDVLDTCEDDLEDLREHIAELEGQSADLFEEWSADLELFDNPRLRAKSERMLDDTRQRFERFVAALGNAEVAIDPVLSAYQDYVLFFNHNLNPRAIVTLEDTYPELLEDVAALKRTMNKTLKETDDFIRVVEGRNRPGSKPAQQPEGRTKQIQG
jgi:hypothetical protein